jgi:hypothetical protein
MCIGDAPHSVLGERLVYLVSGKNYRGLGHIVIVILFMLILPLYGVHSYKESRLPYVVIPCSCSVLWRRPVCVSRAIRYWIHSGIESSAIIIITYQVYLISTDGHLWSVI